jgi:cyclase
MSQAATLELSGALRPRLEEVADGMYAYVQPDGGWCVSNAGLLVGRDSVTVIDTAATERRARLLRSAIATITPVAPGILVNTHHHGDHTFGNHVFQPEAVIIAHELARREMIDGGLGLTRLWPQVEWGEVRVTPPVVTFADRLLLHVDDLPVELRHVGPAHTTNDVVAWVPGRRLLFAGDVLWSGGTPFVLMGSVAGSISAIERLRALRPETIVCGHGPVAGPEVLDTTLAYLSWLRDVARAALAEGLTPLEAARANRHGPFADLPDAERLVGNLHRCYAELRGAAPGEPVDVVTAFREMVELNDGRLPDCLA